MRLHPGRLQTALNDVDDARSVTGSKIQAGQGITLIFASLPLLPGILPGNARDFPETSNDARGLHGFRRRKGGPFADATQIAVQHFRGRCAIFVTLVDHATRQNHTRPRARRVRRKCD
jgi:hypothetical protein